MNIRDLQHARECARALAGFFDALREDDDAGEEGINADELCKAHTFARALDATLDDTFRRVKRQDGFTLIEVLVSTTLAMMVVGALSVVLLHSAKLAATLSKVAYEESQARARLARQQVDITTPIEGVTVTLDPSTPEDATCHLYHLVTTTPSGKSFDAYASRGCAAQ